MHVRILRAKIYREKALAVGDTLEMDDETAVWFCSMGWATKAEERSKAAVAEPEEAPALTPAKRRKAKQ